MNGIALAVEGQLLICQTEPSDAGNAVGIVTLNTREGGEQVVAGRISLPADVQVSIDDTLNSSFAVSARGAGAQAVVTWQHSKRPVRGIPEDEDILGLAGPERTAAAPPSVTSSGTFRIDLSSGAVSASRSTRAPSGALVQRAAALPPEARIAGAKGTQFISADGGYVLSSERLADDSVWGRFQLSIYDRASGRRVGAFNTHLADVPFFVLEAKVIFETGPFVRRTEQGLIDECLKVRAIDLRSGQELRSREVRDTTTQRGPFPP